MLVHSHKSNPQYQTYNGKLDMKLPIKNGARFSLLTRNTDRAGTALDNQT